MKEQSTKTNLVSNSIIGGLGSIIINNIDIFEFLSERIKEPYSTFIFFILSFVILFFIADKTQKFILAKFPKIKDFYNKHKKKIGILTVSVVCIVLAIVMADNAFKISDSTIPTIMIKAPKNNIIASEQYDTPLIYHVYFDDETELKEIDFTADSIDLGDVTADVNINKVTNTEYVLSLSNIVGESGAHHITLKEGIAKDIVNNETKSVEAKKFYLYNKESDIDNESPKINFTQIDTNDDTALFNISITDNSKLFTTRLNKEDIIFIGFSADLVIERDLNNYSVKLSNIEKTDENCFVVIIDGVATDSWSNRSVHTINNIEI